MPQAMDKVQYNCSVMNQLLLPLKMRNFLAISNEVPENYLKVSPQQQTRIRLTPYHHDDNHKGQKQLLKTTLYYSLPFLFH
jgi:hypothetical protein